VPNFIIQTSYQTVATKTFEICSRAVQTYSCTQSIDVFGHRKVIILELNYRTYFYVGNFVLPRESCSKGPSFGCEC
jgi:hypothetical protein